MSNVDEITRAYNEYIEMIAIVLNQQNIAVDYLSGLGFGFEEPSPDDLEEKVAGQIKKNGKEIKKTARKFAAPIIQAKEDIRKFLLDPARDAEFAKWSRNVIEENYSEDDINGAIENIEKFDAVRPLYDPFKLGLKKERNPITRPFFDILKLHGVKSTESLEEQARQDIEKSFDMLEAGEEISFTPDVTRLEQELEDVFKETGIKESHQLSLKTYMNLIKIRDIEVWKHCARTALKGVQVVSTFADPRAIFCAGMLHDIGKVMPDFELNSDDLHGTNEQKKNLMKSFELIKDSHAFSANIIRKYRRFISEGELRIDFDSDSSEKEIDFSRKSRNLIDFYAGILMIIDRYDELTSELDNQFGDEQDMAIHEKVKQTLLELHPHQRLFIEDLYDKGVF